MISPSSEKLFAQTFDRLIGARRDHVNFAQEAELAATFTKYYIRTIFKLNDYEFHQLLKAHRELHEKARHFELRGKNPLPLLHRAIEKGDLLGRILTRHAQHLGALDCLLDVRATAALVHHLLRLPIHEELPEQVTGTEFGAGLGILSVAGIIPFLASGRAIAVFAFEQIAISTELAATIHNILVEESEFGRSLALQFSQMDITTTAPYRYVREQEQQRGPLALWISETFGYQSHTPVIAENCTTFSLAEPAEIPAYSRQMETQYDPFPTVLKHSCRYFDNFLLRIRNAQLAAFPDVVTPRVIINGKKSSLLGPDGNWRSLHEIGEPYRSLPRGAQTRWALEMREAPAPGKPKTVAHKRKKRQL